MTAFNVKASATGSKEAVDGKGDHWIAVVINGEKNAILFGNSLGNKLSPHVSMMVEWWLGKHDVLTDVDTQELPIA